MSNKKERIARLNQSRTNKIGETGVCIGFDRSIYYPIIQMDNGDICHSTWDNFDKGIFHIKNKQGHLNEIKENSQGLKMKIIQYNSYNDITVKFESGYVKTNTNYGLFKRGAIKDLYYPSVCNKGYIGGNTYDTLFEIEGIKPYKIWVSILKRCYNTPSKFITSYSDCSVDERWLNYQNFVEWIKDNAYSVPGQVMEIDKDILIKNNRIYGPDTCLIVPSEINSMLIKEKTRRGNLPIGVCVTKNNKTHPYRVHMERHRLGPYMQYVDTPEEGFQIYKQIKEAYIKYIADIYKEQIPSKVYDALYLYEVEMTD